MAAGETFLKTNLWDLPGDTVDKNLPANSGDMGSVPGPGRVLILRSNQTPAPTADPETRTCAPQLLSPCATATKPHTPGVSVLLKKRSHRSEKPTRLNEE